MDRRAGDARARQATAAGIGTVFGAAEHDGAEGALTLEHAREQRVLGLKRNRQHVLLNRVGGGGHRGDLHAGGVVHQIGDGAHGLLVQGRGEQQGLTVVARVAHNAAHGGQKAHVEHAVGLVEHEDLHLVERAGALVDEVLQAARRGDEDVAAALELVALRVVAHASHHGDARVTGAPGDGPAHVLDLLGELTRGRDDEHERALRGDAATRAPAGHVRQVVHGGQQERRGLAGAGLGGGEHVLAVEGVRDRGCLHGRGRGVAHVGHRGEHFVGEAEVGKGRAIARRGPGGRHVGGVRRVGSRRTGSGSGVGSEGTGSVGGETRGGRLDGGRSRGGRLDGRLDMHSLVGVTGASHLIFACGAIVHGVLRRQRGFPFPRGGRTRALHTRSRMSHIPVRARGFNTDARAGFPRGGARPHRQAVSPGHRARARAHSRDAWSRFHRRQV